MQEIDKIDKVIADLLVEDGRMSAAEIARRIGGVTERVVRYRIDRLVETGVIRISAIPNPKELGLAVVADIKVQVEPGRALQVARQLAQYEFVTYVGCSIGEGDIGIQVVAPDNEFLYRFSTEILGNVPGVQKTTTMIVPIILKDIYQWTIPEGLVSEVETSFEELISSKHDRSQPDGSSQANA